MGLDLNCLVDCCEGLCMEAIGRWRTRSCHGLTCSYKVFLAAVQRRNGDGKGAGIGQAGIKQMIIYQAFVQVLSRIVVVELARNICA